jgi:hypothetical protein
MSLLGLDGGRPPLSCAAEYGLELLLFVTRSVSEDGPLSRFFLAYASGSDGLF